MRAGAPGAGGATRVTGGKWDKAPNNRTNGWHSVETALSKTRGVPSRTTRRNGVAAGCNVRNHSAATMAHDMSAARDRILFWADSSA